MNVRLDGVIAELSCDGYTGRISLALLTLMFKEKNTTPIVLKDSTGKIRRFQVSETFATFFEKHPELLL
jgi:hypothetical protein